MSISPTTAVPGLPAPIERQVVVFPHVRDLSPHRDGEECAEVDEEDWPVDRNVELGAGTETAGEKMREKPGTGGGKSAVQLTKGNSVQTREMTIARVAAYL